MKRTIYLLTALVLVPVVLLSCKPGAPAVSGSKNIPKAATEAQAMAAAENTGKEVQAAVVFEDMRLEAKVRELVEINEGNIYPSDMEKIQVLEIRDEDDIKSLKGLEFCTNLFKLDIICYALTDIGAISNLKNIEYLYLVCGIHDIRALGKLTKLKLLALEGGRVGDISALAGLAGLETLYLSHNIIRDIGPLAGMANLKELYLDNNIIRDISPLAGMANLRTLYMSNNRITDISTLASLNRLERVGMNNNMISDLGPLSKLTNLTVIGMDYNGISDISALKGLTNLTYASLQHNNISEIGALVPEAPEGWTEKKVKFVLYNNPLSAGARKDALMLSAHRMETVY